MPIHSVREASPVLAMNSAPEKGRLGEIAKQFLRLGFVAYGGPAAHIAMMEEEFVRRRAWVTRQRFVDLVGAVSLLPGPSSTELAIYLGEIRGGVPGLLVAGGCFILPAALFVVLLAWAYQKYGALPQIVGLLFGIKPVVVALIAPAIWNLARTALKSGALVALALLFVVLAIWGLPTLLLLGGAGVLWMLFREGSNLARGPSALATLVGSGVGGVSLGLVPVFLYFLKVGAILFGSGYVLLAVLHADLVVKLHWLTNGQLLDAVAVSQATPGPFFTVATFIGYILAGWKGAVLATLGMFFPAFIYVGMTARFLPQIRKSGLAGAFLDGVNAAAVALMAFVGWQFARDALTSVPAILIALVSGVLIFRYKINTVWMVLGGALAGTLLQFFK
jgi:chromate transporter